MKLSPILSGPSQELDALNFSDLVRLFLHDKWKIIGLALASGLIATLYAYTQQSRYKSTATVLVEPRENKAVHMQEVYDPGIETDSYFLTQLEVIRSRQLAAKVVQRLNLTAEDEFRGAQPNPLVGFWRNKVLKWWGSDSAPKKDHLPMPGEESLTDKVIDNLLNNVTTEPLIRTRLIHISVVSQSAQLAANAANSLADAYIEYGLEARLETSKKATRWLTDKLADIRGNLEKSEAALQAFREKQQIVNVGGSRGLLDDELLDNARRLREAQKTKTDRSSTYAKIQEAGNDVRKLEEISDLLRLPLVQSAKGNLLSSLEALKQLQQRYGEKHPQLSNALTRVEAAERTFRDQILLAAQNIRTEYEIARENERVLGSTVESEKDQIRALDRKEYELSVLEREVASNKQLYDLFLTSFKDADSSSSYEPINVRVLEPAIPTEMVFEPLISKYAEYGTLIGLIIAIGLVFLRQALDETVRSPEELESITRLPVISVVPKISSGISNRKSLAILFSENPRTPFAEGIRSIRAGLKLNDVDQKYKRILVTSAVPGEGKSSLASCLAMAFGNSEKVLLIDADLRAPTISKVFEMPKGNPGIMELLTGEASLESCLYLHEPSQIHVLAVEKTPANPAEVINSAAFAKLVSTLSEQFDRVIIDSPPCQAASDALVLSKMVDVVLFTLMADSTRRRAVAAAMKQLNQVQAHVVGSVLNQVNPRKNPHYADAYYYAREYYG